MKLVTSMGYVYRLSDYNYRCLLTRIKNDEEPEIEKLGRLLGIITADVTDMDAEEAASELENA